MSADFLPWCGSGLIPPYRYGGLHTGKKVIPRAYTDDESRSDPRIEVVPPTQTNSINTDECSRGSIPVYSSSSSDFKRVRFQINPDLVIFPTDDYDLTDAPEAISQPLTIYFCPSCCMCSLLCCQVYISSNLELLTQNRLFIIIWLQVLKSVERVIFVRRSNGFSSSILLPW